MRNGRNRRFRGFRNFSSRGASKPAEIEPERTGGKDTHCQWCNANVIKGESHTDRCMGNAVLNKRYNGPKIREKVLQPGEGFPGSIRELTVAEMRVAVSELTAEVQTLARQVRVLEHDSRIQRGLNE